ncbi:hypothetical protein PIB30_051016 [Stylosanthes scabra]|uniref:Ribosomal protein S14 n=1 Tax=Stylosanthes scabra TaxID=79078 RepID=A0ABU6VG75_9FABA|nr:hypothetical protein [Stylosanthes scabra]
MNHSERHLNVMMSGININPLFRSESFGHYNSNYHYYSSYPDEQREKRQLYLRSYQFCRKKSLTERIKRSLVRVKKVVWLRLISAKKLRKLVFSRIRIKCGFYYRRKRSSRLLNNFHHTIHHDSSSSSSSSSCLW